MSLKAPFPYFGGKALAAETVWRVFGDVDNYVEPFCGSAAMLLSAPEGKRVETINDAERHRCLILIADIDGLLKSPEDQRLLERFARNVADFERFKSSNCQ